MNKTFGPLIIAAIVSGAFAFSVVTYAITMPTRSQLAAVGSIQTKAPQDKSAIQKQFLFSEINSLNSDILNPTLANKASKNKASNLSADKTQTDKVLVQKAEQRKVLMKQLMKMDPRLFNALAIKKQAWSTLPASIQSKVEQNITITGKISTIHVDDFTNKKNSHYEYYIQTPQVKYYFYPTSDTPILSGTTVKVTGYAIDDQISANTDQNPPVILNKIPIPMTDSVGNQRTLVLLVKSFAGDSEPFTPAQGQGLVFNSQFQNFMKEQSYGKVSFSVDVFGWMVPGPDDLVSRAVDTYNIDLNNYDRIVYLYTNTYGGNSSLGKSSFNVNGKEYLVSHSSVGLDGYNLPSDWGNQSFAWTNLDYVLSHELGHALGVAHANAWVCADGQILYGDCSHYEYGNYYDTMGTTGYSLDYNAYFKEQLGWIPASQVLSITHSGSYTINPLELVNGVKLATVDILNTTTTPFTIELRKAQGFDSNLNSPDLIKNQNGIFINRIQDNSGVPATELLDLSPSPTSDWYTSIKSATLNLPSAGSSVYSFVDAGRGITIGPVSNVSASSISFNVTLGTPVCKRSVPIIANLDYSHYVAAGGRGGYVNMSIVNQDYYGCAGTSNFNIVPTSQSLWQYDIYPPEDIAIKPGESSYKNLNFVVPVNTPAGRYSLGIDVVNKTSGLKKHTDLTIQVTEPLVITNINPVSGPIGTNISITGTGFNPEDNQVFMRGSSGWTYSQTISSSDGKIIYTIPSIINTCEDNDCHSIPTPDGDYTINVWANSFSASTDFHVGTTTPPTNATDCGLSFTTGTLIMNDQVGLFEQDITVTNNTGSTVPGVRVTIESLSAGSVYNQMGTNGNGKQFVQHNYPLAAGQSVTLRPSFYVSTRNVPTITYSVQAVQSIDEPSLPAGATSGSFIITPVLDNYGHPILEWNTVAGKEYAIQYSDDSGVTWHTAFGNGSSAVVWHTAGNNVFWLDYGPGQTRSSPTLPSRQYHLYGFSTGASSTQGPSATTPVCTTALPTNATSTTDNFCNSQTLDFSWDRMEGATSYTLLRHPPYPSIEVNATFTIPQPASGARVNFSDTTAPPLGGYYYHLIANYPTGSSNPGIALYMPWFVCRITNSCTNITSNSITSGGSITYGGPDPITVRGIVWDTSTNPTTALSTKITNGPGPGSFTSSITGLTPNTTYHIRAYVTLTAAGTIYGDNVSCKTTITPSSTQPSITVSSPNGEETFTSDQSIPITWNMNYANTGTSIIVRLLQYGDGNVFDSKLIQGTSGDNQFTVPAGKVGPGRYMAEVADNPGYGGQNVYDDSNSYFTVANPTTSQPTQSSNDYFTPMQMSTSSLGAAIWDVVSQYLNYHY